MSAKQPIKISVSGDEEENEKETAKKTPVAGKKKTVKTKSGTGKTAKKTEAKTKEGVSEKIINTDEGDLKVKIRSLKKPESLEPPAAAVPEPVTPKKPVKIGIIDVETGETTEKQKPQRAPQKAAENTIEEKLKNAEAKFAEKVAPAVPEPEAEPDDFPRLKPRSTKLYRKIALSFIILTVLLLGVIGYFTFVKVDITLIPNQERISNNLIFDIVDKGTTATKDDKTIEGVVKKVPITIADNFKSTKGEVIGEETVGTVKIINNYTKNQPLVATTRILSPDGKLYRLKETVNVPAGGEVEAQVYADIPGEDKAIQPTTFSIPGLWAGLQDQIYAQSSEPFVYEQKKKMSITQDDIDNAVRELKQGLLAKAKDEINTMYKDYDQIIYSVDENSIKYQIDGKVGEEKDEFAVNMDANVITVAFNEDQAVTLAKQKFISSLPDNKEIISFSGDNLLYSLNEYDTAKGVASVNATFEGKVSIKEDAQIVEIDKILGLNEKQLEAYLSGLPEIAGYEIKFFPSFIKKVPNLADRVNVVIKK